MEYHETFYGTKAIDRGELVGWILRLQDRRWSFKVVGQSAHPDSFASSSEAKAAFENAITL